MSTPLLQEFNPRRVPWQYQTIQFMDSFDPNKGVLEMLFSGSIGSAKSICAAHILVIHCLENDGARVLVLRRALKDLKRTIWATILSHLADIPHAIDHYNKTEMRIRFKNGSEIIGDSYDKGDLEKFRSLELSGGVFEEAIEIEKKEVYEAVKMRVGRLPSVKKNFMLALTNPGEPSHWLYKYFIQDVNHPNKETFYSLTEQNPFLPKWYIENLRADLDPQMVKRMLMGMWISIIGSGPYYAYNPNVQFLKDKAYVINPKYPVDISHDFNIAEGKPMSACLGQYIEGVFHIAKDFVIEGFDTNDIIDEIITSDFMIGVSRVRVFGDFYGKSKDPRSKTTDYQIIEKALIKSNFKVEMQVPRSGNPPIRSRQNMVNAHCKNDLGQVRLFVYKDATIVDDGLRLTKLKKGSSYQEDDSDSFQHVTSALGYYICRVKDNIEKRTDARIIIR